MNKNTSVADILRNLRPTIHFTAQKNWINDPNGLVFFEDEWHLFFQYNPYGTEWGNMNWGHAVSKDLLTWAELEIAIPEDDENMIFSGSCVIDWKNTSGFGNGTIPPIIAIYTAHAKSGELQTQCIAYSNDKGRNFTKYANNPVLNVQKADFRDPKVFWHAQTNAWVMIVANSKENTVSFYNSPNLKDWHFLSTFGNCGAPGSLWECPDLISLNDENGQTKWVLKIDVFSFEEKPQSICQYFIGDFDGANFLPDRDENNQIAWDFADFGHDFYAAVSFSDIPELQNRRVWLGWMNSHHYAKNTPTSPWRGSMTIPREIGVLNTDGGYKITQKPIGELFLSAKQIQNPIDFSSNKPIIIDAVSSANKDFEIEVCFESGENLFVKFDVKENQFSIDRTGAFISNKFPEIANCASAQRISNLSEINIQIVIDKFSIEIFMDDGLQVFSELYFAISDRFQIKTSDGIKQIEFREIEIA